MQDALPQVSMVPALTSFTSLLQGHLLRETLPALSLIIALITLWYHMCHLFIYSLSPHTASL